MAATDGIFDCLILGGGPAGLAAAVYMGRYLRPTLVLDEKKPRTRWHRPIAHNVLGFPAGIHRNQLLDWGRAHIAKYPAVIYHHTTVVTIRQDAELFIVSDDQGRTYRGRGLIIALGAEYLLPDLPGIFHYAGHSIFHCPECDGYKCVDQRVAVIGPGRGSAEMALGLSVWTRHITLCTHGDAAPLDAECLEKLTGATIAIERRRIVGLRGDTEAGQLQALLLEGGAELPCTAAFSNLGSEEPTDLLRQLPLELHNGRYINVDYRQRTNIPRCYAAGDIVSYSQTQLAVAMGTGATAAIWLHKELLPPHLCLSGKEWDAPRGK